MHKYPDKQMVPSAYFYKLLGHCLRVVPLRVKKSGNLLPYRYSNINQSHSSLHTQGLTRTILIPFRVPDITSSDQGIHFTSQNTQCWALGKGIQWNFHLPIGPRQLASLRDTMVSLNSSLLNGSVYGDICIHIADSLCYKAETNTPL